MQEHPTQIELELARTGEAEEAVAEHLEGCAECRTRLSRVEALAAELDRPLEPLTIPAERERAVIELARKRADQIQKGREGRARRPLRRLAWAVPLAAAAAVALFFLVPGLRPAETPVASEALVVAGPDDINRDGRVDILDALALARAIEADAAAGDSDDVERVAMTAVAIAPRGGAR
jgi:hypothetical protein